jgi:hypothetical protein
MVAVARLVTLVDVDDRFGDPRQLSLSARHEAALEDGRRVVLLDDRGWTTSLGVGDIPDSSRHGQPAISAVWSVEAVQETARVVVGPDEPPVGRSLEDMGSDHWAHLSRVLAQHGVVVDAADLKRLPHDVVLSRRLLTLIGREPAKEEP